MTSAEITSNVIATISLVVAVGSAIYAALAYRLAMRQDKRKNPALTFIDVNGYVSYENGRDIAISAVIANQSDSDNAITRAELRVVLSRADAEWSVRLVFDPNVLSFRSLKGNALVIPTRMQAHDTVAGWLFFHMAESVLGDARVERYIVEITDSHSMMKTFEPSLLQDFRAGADV